MTRLFVFANACAAAFFFELLLLLNEKLQCEKGPVADPEIDTDSYVIDLSCDTLVFKVPVIDNAPLTAVYLPYKRTQNPNI